MREMVPQGVDVDTCHGTFMLHKAESESMGLLEGYHLVVVDEFVEFIDGSSSKTSKRNPPMSYEPSLPRAPPPRV